MKPAEIRLHCLKIQAEAGLKPDTELAAKLAPFWDDRLPGFAFEALRLALAKGDPTSGADAILKTAGAYYTYITGQKDQ